jgi:hypothetical protein
MSHVSLNIGCKTITGYTNGLIAYDTAQCDHGYLGCSSSYIDNHTSFRGFNIDANA